MHYFFSNILCIFSTIVFCEFAVSSSTKLQCPFETESASSFISFSKESERIEFQIERYDRLFLENPITNRQDFFQKNILGFTEIALSGIEYVQYYYMAKIYPTLQHLSEKDQTIILEQCAELKNEIDAFIALQNNSHVSVGMTPAEFMSFNLKLATLQTIRPSSFSAFRKDKAPYHTLISIPFYNVNFWMERQEKPAFSERAMEDIFFCNPYVIYTPGGAFSIHRLMNNILSDQHHYSLLMGLPIGNIDIHKSPHDDFFREPVEFLNHDFQHAMLFFSRKDNFEEFKEQWASPYQTLDLKNPCIELAAFYAFHEDDFAVQSIFSCLLFQKTYLWHEPPLEALKNTKIIALKDYLSFYGCKHGRGELSSTSNYKLEVQTIVHALSLEFNETRDSLLQRHKSDFHNALHEMYKDRIGKKFEENFKECEYYRNAFAQYLRYEVGVIVDQYIKESLMKHHNLAQS